MDLEEISSAIYVYVVTFVDACNQIISMSESAAKGEYCISVEYAKWGDISRV